MEISLDIFLLILWLSWVIYNKKNRAVFLNKNGKKEISVAIISKKNSKSFLITNVCNKIIRKLQERQILCH